MWAHVHKLRGLCYHLLVYYKEDSVMMDCVKYRPYNIIEGMVIYLF